MKDQNEMDDNTVPISTPSPPLVQSARIIPSPPPSQALSPPLQNINWRRSSSSRRRRKMRSLPPAAPGSAGDAANVKKVVPLDDEIDDFVTTATPLRQNVRSSRFMPYLRDRIRWPNIRLPKLLPEGFHFPASPVIKKLLYVGMVILSTLMFVMLGKTGYERYKENQLANERFRIRHAERNSLTPWDLPSVQQKMLDYLGDDYREIKPKAWNFPYIDDYVVFPGDYDLPESMQRGIKRKHLDMLYEIVKKKQTLTNKSLTWIHI